MSAGGRILVVVPARLASRRLPRKLLLDAGGMPLLARTLSRCLEAGRPAGVIAAVDDPELEDAARQAGAEAVRTPPDLPSGTDRVWAAVRDRADVDFVVNVQADEAEIEPEAVDAVCAALTAGGDEAVTLSAPLPAGAREDPHAVKVVTDLNGRALYFSRAPVPWPRDGDAAPAAEPRLHVGVYGFSRALLARFAAWEPTPLERTEHLEQLRLLEHGVRMRVLPWPRGFLGIDSRSDYDELLRRLAGEPPSSA